MNEKAAGMDKEEVSEEPESTKVKVKIEEPKENIRKRSGRRLKMKAPKRYQNEVPKGFDRVLWGDLMLMFNPNDEDEFWNTQHDWNVVKKKYPLKRKVLLQMLELKLESKEDSTMALELIRFVKKLIAELKPEDSDGNEEDL
ncbi:hypothetical protein Tco_1196886 [Tanacetum coccineum]